MRPSLITLIVAMQCVAAPAQTVMSGWDVPGFGSNFPRVTGPGDLNADGYPDVVLGGGGCVRVWSGFDGALLWQACDAAAGLGTSVATAGDVDFDGVNDIVAAASGAGGYTRIFSGQTGSVIRTIPVATSGVDGGRDFDGDGIPDQLGTVYVNGGVPGQNAVHVFSGLSGATLLTLTNAWCNCSAVVSAAFIADVDGNGFDDVAVSFLQLTGGGAIAVLNGPTGITHALITGLTVLPFISPQVADVGDMTGDGKPEVGLTGTNLIGANFWAYDVALGGIMPASTWVRFFGAGGSSPSPGNVARLGDIDGDGRSEVVFETRHWNGTYSTPFQYVLSGATGLPLVTANAPGFVSPFNVPPGQVAALGDVNLDGAIDFIHAWKSTSSGTCRVSLVSTMPLPAAGPSTNIGGGCGPIQQTLQCNLPHIGQNWQFSITGGGFLSADLVLDLGAPSPFSFGTCTWHPDLAHIASWFVVPIGGTGIVWVHIPPIPSLGGSAVTSQAITYGTLGTQFTNGMLSVLNY